MINRDRMGRIKKGVRLSPKTEFKKGQRISPKTEFKKGNTPYKNPANTGTELVMKGELRVKLSNGKWGYKKRIVYEKYNKPIHNNDVIIFLDGNKLNCEIENLYRLTRAELVVLNRNHLISSDRNLTVSGILYVKLLIKCKSLENMKE